MLVYLQGEGKTNMKSYKPVIDYYQKKTMQKNGFGIMQRGYNTQFVQLLFLLLIALSA